MKLYCPEHPNLYIPKHGVQFEDGCAEVPDATGRKILTESPHVCETESEPETESESGPARRKR